MAKMANFSGISPTELTMYQIWQIADHIMVNVPNGLSITEWEKENMNTIMYLNDLTFYVDFSNEEMSKLYGGLYPKKKFPFSFYKKR